MRNTSGPVSNQHFARSERYDGYDAEYPDGGFGEFYDGYYEEEEEDPFGKLVEAFKKFRARKKDKKKKKHGSSSSDSSDDDKSRKKKQPQQPVQYMNAIQPALITHYPAYGQPIQTLAYVTRPIPVANAPVVNAPPIATAPVASVFNPPAVSDLQQLAPDPLRTDLISSPSSSYNPPEPRQYSTLRQDNDFEGPPRLPMEPPNFFPSRNKVNEVGPPRPMHMTTKHSDSPGSALTPPSVENFDRHVSAHKGTGLRPLSHTPLRNFDRESSPHGKERIRQHTDVITTVPPPSVGLECPGRECFRVSPSTFSKYHKMGTIPLNAAVTMTSSPDIGNVGITDVNRVYLPNYVNEDRPIKVWPDQPPQADITLQIDGKIYAGDNIIERLQELQCLRSKLNRTPVSRMIALLLENDDAKPEDYQLIGEDNVIMKWTAMMGDYKVRDGARLRLRRRKKQGRVVSRSHTIPYASKEKTKKWSHNISETTSTGSSRRSRNFSSREGNIMY